MNRKPLLGAMRAMRAIKAPVAGKASAKRRPSYVVHVPTLEYYQELAAFIASEEGERLVLNMLRRNG